MKAMAHAVGAGCGEGGAFRAPLFPLNAVLFPDGRITLRVFEPRYMDMIKLCLREEIGFGVCMIKDGSRDTGVGCAIAGCGTYTVIRDWEQLADGLLGLHCYGEKRFRLQAQTQGPDGMRIGDLNWFPEKPCSKRPRIMENCVEYLLRKINGEAFGKTEKAKYLQDPNWVGYRLAEILPLTIKSRQTLLEMDDAALRLKALYAVIQTLSSNTRPS